MQMSNKAADQARHLFYLKTQHIVFEYRTSWHSDISRLYRANPIDSKAVLRRTIDAHQIRCKCRG